MNQNEEAYYLERRCNEEIESVARLVCAPKPVIVGPEIEVAE